MTDPRRAAQVERLILGALVTQEISPSEWSDIQHNLAAHLWREPEHAVVYQAIVQSRGRDQKHWREHLAAETARMGFPDVDWKTLLGSTRTGTPETKLESLMRQLEADTLGDR
jgi:hypothetical protein